jgi:hypothetical protein
MGKCSFVFFLAALLCLVLATSAVAADDKVKTASYRAQVTLRVTDGDGETRSFCSESVPITQTLLFVDGEGNHHVRVNRGKSTLTGHIDGKDLGLKGRAARTDFLVFDKGGNLLNAMEIARGIFLCGEDLGKIPCPKDFVVKGKEHILTMAWPIKDGPVIPVTVRYAPKTRSGGEGDCAWREITFRLEGRKKIKGAIPGTLHLKGKGRMVMSESDRVLIASDFHIECALHQKENCLARAEQKICLSMEGNRFKDIPKYGMNPPASSGQRRSFFAGGLSRFLLLGFCLFGALTGSFGYVCHSRRARYHRLERLVILVLIPALLVIGVSDPVEASVFKDIFWGAASIVTGAVAAVPVLPMLAVGANMMAWGAAGAAGVALTLGGFGLAAAAVGLVGYGGYKIYKGIKKHRAKKKLAEGKDPVERARAARTLGDMGDKDTTATLLNALADPDPQVRIGAAEALATMKDPAAVPVLKKLLEKEKDPKVRKAINDTIQTLELSEVSGGGGISDRLRDLMDD